MRHCVSDVITLPQLPLYRYLLIIKVGMTGKGKKSIYFEILNKVDIVKRNGVGIMN